MLAPAVFAFGLVAFGFLGMGPVTIAVDSYGPVADNAQSIFELSTIAKPPGAQQEIKREFGFEPNFEQGQALPGRKRRRRQHVQGDGQAGADRHRGRRRDDAHFLDHHGAHRRPDQRGRESEPVAAASAVPAGSDHRRRGDLLVHRRIDAGRRDRGLSGRRIHQGQHPAGQRRDERIDRRQQARRRDLHAVRPERHVQHLPGRVLHHARICLPRSNTSSSAT